MSEQVYRLRDRRRGALTAAGFTKSRTLPENCTTNRSWTAWTPDVYGSPIGGETQRTEDYVTPHFWKLKKENKWISPNEFFSVKVKNTIFGYSDYISEALVTPACSNPNVYAKAEYAGNRLLAWIGTSDKAAISCVANNDVRNLIGQVETRVMAERGNGTANYVESLAELDQLFSMLHNPLENAHKFTVNFQKADSYKRLQRMYRHSTINGMPKTQVGKLGKANAYLQLVASEWLRFRYGVSPFMSDIKAAWKTLSEVYDIGPKRHTSRANGMVKSSKVERTTLPSGVYEFYYLTKYQDEVSIKALWVDEYRATPFDKLGLTFHNIVGVPWELTRLSFVVDWFVNVGDLIYANIPRVDYSPLGGSKFTVQTTQTTWVGDGFKDLSPATMHLSGSFSDGIDCLAIKKSRTMLDGRTALVIKSDFRLDNWIRATDALTLLVNQLGKLRF